MALLVAEDAACLAGAETIIYDRVLLLLTSLVREKNTILEIFDRLQQTNRWT